GLERIALPAIAMADRLEMGELTPAHDADHGPRQALGLHLAPQGLAHPAPPLGGNDNRFKIRAAQDARRHGIALIGRWKGAAECGTRPCKTSAAPGASSAQN